jgi:hypothetical protein
MSKKPSESESLSAKQGEKEEKGSKDLEAQQQQHRRHGEPKGQKRDQQSQKKQTVQFDEGQKFTSDDDLLKRRSA